MLLTRTAPLILGLLVVCCSAFAQSGFGPKQVITTEVTDANDVFSADLDGDGDLDALSASASSKNDKVTWYVNGGEVAFGPQVVISAAPDDVQSVFATDLDGDGDMDVLSASAGDDKVAWYENEGGGVFGAQVLITTQADSAASVFASDLDGDGDLDVLSASHLDMKVAWYENLDGSFGPQQVISIEDGQANAVFAADLDGDGDPDVLSASLDGKVAWYENLSLGVFGPQQVLSASGPYATDVHAADLDGDADLDVLACLASSNKVAWFQNLGDGTFGPQLPVTSETLFPLTIVGADVNGDGFIDPLSASYEDNKIAWYANLSGNGFGEQKVITTDIAGPRCAYAADVDGDGDPDVLSASNQDNTIAWYENGPLEIESVQAAFSFASDPVLIQGKYFDAETEVLLDGAPEPVVSFTETVLAISPAPAAPGLRDVTVFKQGGPSTTLEDGLRLWPVLVSSTTGIGGTLDIGIDNGSEGLYALALATGFLPSPISIASPPTWYGVLLDPTGPLFVIATGAFATSDPIDLSFPVPSNPALVGLSLYLQAWCQQGFFGPEVTYSFTNMGAVTL